ncbi:MAG TPA: LysE family translocator [Candidatus Dormibacteraeota bacterium]|nr:LysE family translocator [Candidatus Dormibacteraeota bacterium]
MIGFGSYLAFLGVSLLVICTPGQDTALTIRNTLLGTRRKGFATALGVSAGQATWSLATSAGLAVILAASAPLFLAIRLAGAVYLIYLGSRSLISAIRRYGPHERIELRSGSRLSTRTAFAQGLLSNLSNAKMVAFFISLLPPFAGPHPSFLLLLVLGFNFCMLTLAWLAGYSLAVDRLGGWLRRSSARRALDGLLGAVLVALGLRVSSEALASS